MSKARELRALLSGPDIVMAPGAPDCLTARIIERAGYPAVYMTGFGATASRLGMPDIGLLTLTEMTEHARNMTRAVAIPIVADADTGYGGPSNIHRTVREYIQAGVAAIHLEDQVAPKRCGQLSGIRLMGAEESARRLECAIAARGSDDLIIIGRTDAIGAGDPAEAVRRAKLYREAGADLVFVDGIKRVSEVELIAREVPGPKVVSIVDGNETVALTAKDLGAMGFSMALYAVTALFTAARAIADAMATLKRDGSPKGIAPQMTYAEYCDIVDLASFSRRDDVFGV
jgi:2-methylisocitrate lyase-like PEP mutase family enzyme